MQSWLIMVFLSSALIRPTDYLDGRDGIIIWPAVNDNWYFDSTNSVLYVLLTTIPITRPHLFDISPATGKNLD